MGLIKDTDLEENSREEKLEASYDASEDGKGVSIENVKDDAEDSKDADFKPPISKRAEKRKKRPPATLVKPKKKRRKGYDSGDELNSMDVLPSTPPSIEDENLIEKRRSGRNVKRKRYNENNFDLDLGDDVADFQLLPVDSANAKNQESAVAEIKMEDTGDEVQIVEKILAHRIRKRRPKKKKLENIVELKEEKSSILDSENKTSNVSDNENTDTKAKNECETSTKGDVVEK